MYDVYCTDQKMYFFMDEYSPNNMSHAIARKLTDHEIQKWGGQLNSALLFMHTYAIAHLDIKSENVIFDKSSNIKLIGLSRAFLYFDLDQETIIKAPKVLSAPYNDHLPPECFEGSFSPQPTDVWSMGLLIYEMATKTNPMRSEQDPKEAKRGENWHLQAMDNFKFNAIANPDLATLLEKMLNLSLVTRPKFQYICNSDYFKEGKSLSNAPQE